MESISRIFHSHINTSILSTKRNTNPLLRDIPLYDTYLLNSKLTYIWNDIFTLYGWKRIGNAIFTSGDKLVEVKSTFNTHNSKEKTRRYQLLKSQPYESIISGAIVDSENRDYITSDGIRVLSSDNFLYYMLGDDYKEIQQHLKSLVKRFYHNKLVPFMRETYQI